jgi:hypothetical protein
VRGFVVRGSNVPKVTSLSYNVCVIGVAPRALSLSLSLSEFQASSRLKRAIFYCNAILLVEYSKG